MVTILRSQGWSLYTVWVYIIRGGIKNFKIIIILHFCQISAIQEAFAYFDSNKDGLISFHEFQQILTSFGEHVSDNEIGERIRMWDGDGDGKINFAEFLVAMAQILTDTENEERMRDAFRIFDKVK